MQTPEIYQKLTLVLRDVFDDDAIAVGPDLTADDVDGWDSLTHIRLMLTVEKAFAIRFAASEVGKLKNVGELASLIASKTA
ncbi:MAG: acyl carrier protein [Pseudomonadota bacterium]|nr:acyl carrier protein [Pseudomonadota bacterium]